MLVIIDAADLNRREEQSDTAIFTPSPSADSLRQTLKTPSPQEAHHATCTLNAELSAKQTPPFSVLLCLSLSQSVDHGMYPDRKTT